MIEIKKNTEPIELRTLREQAARDGLSPEDAYKRLQRNSELKKKVKDSLITEQGKLCAYCMCRIPRNDVAVEIAPITIEHFIPRNPEDGRDIGQGWIIIIYWQFAMETEDLREHDMRMI